MEQLRVSYSAGGGTSNLKKDLDVFYKVKYTPTVITQIPFLIINPRDIKVCLHRKRFVQQTIFQVALFIIVNNCK